MTDQINPADQPSDQATTQPAPESTPEPVVQGSPVPSPSTPSRRRVSSPMGVAPAIALVGLLVCGLLTFEVYRNWTPELASATDTPSPSPIAEVSGQPATPAPTQTILTNPEITMPGMLVYAKSGSLWVQSGTSARQITQPSNGSQASQPAFAPDGQWIYYIDTRPMAGRWYNYDNVGELTSFKLSVPVLCRIRPDGTGQEDINSGVYRKTGRVMFYWIRQPTITPDGWAAVVSDAPVVPGSIHDTLIHRVNLNAHQLDPNPLPLPATSPLGLADPEYSPDGKTLAYTMEGRAGTFGAPSIWLYSGGSTRKLANGYRAATWSPDGKYIAATAVVRGALDIVVLDAVTGKQVAQVTSDGKSWAPVWSPDGSKLVYMHLTGAIVDLNMVYIAGIAPSFTFKIESNLTDYSGLDGQSTAAWFIPGFGPKPTPSPSPTPAPSTSASAS